MNRPHLTLRYREVLNAQRTRRLVLPSEVQRERRTLTGRVWFWLLLCLPLWLLWLVACWYLEAVFYPGL